MLVKVWGVSQNLNAFGLREHMFIARSGRVYRGYANSINTRKPNQLLTLDGECPLNSLAAFGFECAEQLQDAPLVITRDAWNGGIKEAWEIPTDL